MKANALRTRYVRNSEHMDRTCRNLPPLHVGDRCFLQNRHGNNPRRWDLTGTIMEAKPFGKYCIRVDGSRKVTTRNRRFLKLFHPISTTITPQPHPFYHDQDDPGSTVPAVPNIPLREWNEDVLEDPEDSNHDNNVDPSGAVDLDRELGSANPEDDQNDDARTTVVKPEFRISPKIPLALRRLREHNKHGVKQFINNSDGQRSAGGKR